MAFVAWEKPARGFARRSRITSSGTVMRHGDEGSGGTVCEAEETLAVAVGEVRRINEGVAARFEGSSGEPFGACEHSGALIRGVRWRGREGSAEGIALHMGEVERGREGVREGRLPCSGESGEQDEGGAGRTEIAARHGVCYF
jgi:hypothetical protein